MPDFDTRKPQGSNEPNRPRMTLIANRLSRLLSASKVRILSIASTLRRFLMANRLRTLLIGGGMMLFVAAAALGLLIYSSIELADGGQKVTDLQQKIEGATLTPLEGCPVGGDINQSKIRDMVHGFSSTKKIVFVRGSDITYLYYLGVGGAIDIDANIELYMISTDGTSLTRLTKTTAKEYGANRLPDGRRMNILWDTDGRTIRGISYFDSEPGTTLNGRPPYPPDDIDMYEVNVDGTGLTHLTNTETQEGILTRAPNQPWRFPRKLPECLRRKCHDCAQKWCRRRCRRRPLSRINNTVYTSNTVS